MLLGALTEIGIMSQLLSARFERTRPGGLNEAQFTVLHHFARQNLAESTPTKLARAFQLSKGALTNTLQRLEAGDPSVGIGIVATALWLIQRDGELGKLAAPEHDQGALELDVREAVELGRARAQSSAEARLRAAGHSDQTED